MTLPTPMRYATVDTCHDTGFNDLMEKYVAYLAYHNEDMAVLIAAPATSTFWTIADRDFSEYFTSYEVP